MELVKEQTRNRVNCRTMRTTKSMFHWHENCEICRVINRPCSFLIDGELINANVGDIVVIDECVVHQFIMPDEESQVRLLHLDLGIFINFGGIIHPIKTHIKHEEIINVPGLDKKLNSLYDIMESETGIERDIKENPAFVSIAFGFYQLLVKNFPLTDCIKNTAKKRDEFQSIADWINKHYSEKITVNSIAKKMCISRTKLSTLFKKYSGIGINEYINKLRINKVNRLLEQGGNITEAAYESGFQSIRTFNEVYKSIMGITPREYIKSLNNSR